jgi:fatty acid desaturase
MGDIMTGITTLQRSRASRVVVACFQRVREVECDIAALGYHALLLGSFALLCQGLLPPVVFMVLGLCAYVRNFNALHEGIHTRKAAHNPLRAIRQAAMIVHSPLQLGRRELSRNHHLHHAFPGDPERDPEVAVNTGPWWRAAVAAFLQPEHAIITHVRRAGRISPAVRNVLIYNSAVSVGLLALAGADIVWWFAVTRLGSNLSWFLFDWVLHHPRVWGRPELSLSRVLQLIWSALFTRGNLNGVRNHTLHHRYPFVAGSELPALARFLAEASPADARSSSMEMASGS